jgi:hypothetical protein
MVRRVLPAAVALCAALACNRNTQPVPVPTPIATPTITDTYTGTLSPLGSNLHFFQVQQDSQVVVTLTQLVTVAVAADPTADPPILPIPATPVAAPVTITVGQQALTTLGVTCSSLKTVVQPAGSSPQLTGQALKGTYCVSITDADAVLPRPTSYAVTVAHS